MCNADRVSLRASRAKWSCGCALLGESAIWRSMQLGHWNDMKDFMSSPHAGKTGRRTRFRRPWLPFGRRCSESRRPTRVVRSCGALGQVGDVATQLCASDGTPCAAICYRGSALGVCIGRHSIGWCCGLRRRPQLGNTDFAVHPHAMPALECGEQQQVSMSEHHYEERRRRRPARTSNRMPD